MVDYVPAVLNLEPGLYQYKFKFVWRDNKEVRVCGTFINFLDLEN
jgi:hypothetical protein